MSDERTDEPALYRELGELRNANSALAAELAELRRDKAAADLDLATAVAHVERRLRFLDVEEVRLWAAPWYGGVVVGTRNSVTLTLREGRGERHGDTLYTALEQAARK